MLRFCKGPSRPMGEFLIAPSSVAGGRTVDLHAQLRGTGRIMDACKLVLGGSEVIQVDFNLYSVVPNDRFAGWRVRYQVWPRDVAIRRNMASSNWDDIEALVPGRNVEILDQEGAFIPQAELLTLMNQLEPPNAGSIRWAVTVADDAGLQLQLQGLPGAAPTLNSKPLLRK